jgi:hypothetical protein
MTPEAKVKHHVRMLLTELGIWFFMPVQTGYGVGGIPDFVCCWKGMFIAIECKAPGKMNTVTPLQERTITEIREHGGRAVVVSSAVELRLWLGLLEHMNEELEHGNGVEEEAGVRHEVRVDTGADRQAVATQQGAAAVRGSARQAAHYDGH